MKPTLILFLVLATIYGCSGSKYSHTNGKSIVNVAPVENPKLLYESGKYREQKIADFNEKDGEGRNALIGQAISLALTAANQLIAAEQKKYTVEYKRKIDHIYFYDQVSDKGVFDPTGMQFDGVDIINEITSGKGKNKQTDTAMFITFEVDKENPYSIINNSIFHMKLKECRVNYTRAKMAKTKWYNPISWGQKKLDELLNIDIEVILKTTYITEQGVMLKDEVIGSFLYPIRNMPMNPEHPNYQKFRDDLKGTPMQGFSFLIPRSIGHRIGANGKLEPVFSQARFSMEIRVRESGRDKFVERTFFENSGSMFQSLEKSANKMLPAVLERR